MKRVTAVIANVAALVMGASGAFAGELRCGPPGDPTDCSFTMKKVLFCETQGVLDNGTCVDKAGQQSATQAKCETLGYPYPSNYDGNGNPYTNYKLSSPRTSLASNANAACPPGQKRYWKYSCCRFRACGDIAGPFVGDRSPDGKASGSDVISLQHAVSGAVPLTGQLKKAADLNRDGQLTSSDVDIIMNYLDGAVTLFDCPLQPMKPCDIPCGDANGDGTGVDVPDVVAVVDWVFLFKLPSRCQFWAADTNADGVLNQADLDVINQGFRDGATLPLPGCVPQ